MTYVVIENCKDCKFTDCVTVCPVDCFYKDDTMLYIDPEECIDCGACQPECPVEAIYPEDEVPEDMLKYTEINAQRCQDSNVEQITDKEDPLPTAEEKKARLGF